jgi:magnesium transporter
MDLAKATDIIGEMESDDATDLLADLEESQAKSILNELEAEDAEEFKELLGYEDDSSGGIMGTEFLSLRPETKVDRALEHIKRTGADAQTLNDIFVVDSDERLVGTLSLRDLVVASPMLSVGEVMRKSIVKIHVDSDQEEAAGLFKKYGFSALPVVDSDGKLTGIITADDIMQVVDEEATEDIHRMAGTFSSEESYLSVNARKHWSNRVVWLIILFFADLSSGFIMKGFEKSLESAIALTFFIPLLIGCGGNAGSQASAIVIRSLALKEVHIKDGPKIIWREIRVGLLLGVVTGIGGIVLSFLTPHAGINWLAMGSTIGISIMFTVMIGTAAGAGLPLLASLMKLDPAVVAGPLITTVVDALGLLIYFSAARILIGI